MLNINLYILNIYYFNLKHLYIFIWIVLYSLFYRKMRAEKKVYELKLKKKSNYEINIL